MAKCSARLVFASGHIFGAEALLGLLASEAFRSRSVTIVSTLCLHPKHALSTVGYTDLHQIALTNNLPAITFESISSDRIVDHLSTTPHDYLLAIGLSQLIPTSLLDLPMRFNQGRQRHESTHGCIGMHPTLVPFGRGRAPIPWSIIHGVRDSGVTAFLLEEEADAGNVVAVEPFVIQAKDDAADVFRKVAQCHRVLGKKIAPILAHRALVSRAQPNENVTSWPRRQPSDGWIDFSLPTTVLLALIRASVAPYPGAFFVTEDVAVLVDEAVMLHERTGVPGTILDFSDDGSVTIATRDAAIRVTKYRTLGGRPRFQVGQELLTSKATRKNEG
jgi:methionyl-tRNA formyltransferase